MEPQQPLVCPSHTTQYIGVLIVGLVVGMGASSVYFKQAPAGTENTYQAGFDAAKKRVEESSFGMMIRTPDDIRALSGTVTAVSGNRITIHTQSINPFDAPALLDRTIVITKDTKIIETSQGDMKAFRVEMEAFMKKTQAGRGTGATRPSLPAPVSVTVDILSIKIGDTLTVTAVENIRATKEFSASEIQVQPKAITN